jgi:glycosyltransferase involved in cell wall biosynthesis
MAHPSPIVAAPAPARASARIVIVVNQARFFLSHRLPIALAARDAGHDVWVATPPDETAHRIEGHGLRYCPLRVDRKGTNPLAEAATVARLVQLYREARPDLVHHVTIKPVIYGTIAARITGVPAVVNAVAGLGHVFNAHDARSRALRELVSAGLRTSLAHPNALTIFQNPDDRAVFLGRHILAEDRTVLIRGSGVDLATFVPAPVPPGPPVVVLASRMIWSKGIGEFVEAARRLKASHGARFALVGDPDPGNPLGVPREQLEAWQREGVVEWWGHRDDMPAVLASATVVALPSYYGEGVPKVLLEAAAAGRPIVTTDEPGCREAVDDGDNGLLVPARDVAALARAIGALLSDPDRCRAMGARGRQRARDEFSVEGVVERTLALYDAVLASAPAPKEDAMGITSSYARYTARTLARRPRDIDQYRARVEAAVKDGDRVLHLGCGWDRSEVTIGLRGRAEVIGLDVDRSAGERFHSPFWHADAAELPFADASFDVVCSEYVFEHVDRPTEVMRELARVLRPGGRVVALTPNRWSYKSLAAAMTPHAFHRLAAAKLRPDARAAEDVYPTRYLMNTPAALRALAAEHGFSVSEIALLNNGPTWFRKMPGLFELGRVYHAALDTDALGGLRCGILVSLERTGEAKPVAPAPLRARCVGCGAPDMKATAAGYVCSCGRTYPRTGNTVDVLPGPAAARS